MVGKRVGTGPGPDDVPLPFTIPANSRRTSESARKTSSTFAHGYCPRHFLGVDGKRTGMQLIATHLVWIVHYHTVGKITMACRASGMPICDVPPTDGQMVLVLALKKREADPLHGVRKARCFHKEAQHD